MKEECLRSRSEFNEARSFFLASREKLEASEKQAAAWKEECRLVIVKGHEKEDKYEAALAHMRAEVSTMTKEMAELRASASTPPEPSPMIMRKFVTLEKERGELRAALNKSEDQLDLFRREIVALQVEASTVDPDRYTTRSEHSELLKKREAELLAEMKVQLQKRSC